MLALDTCPSVTELGQAVLGLLPDEEAGPLEAHLSTCAACLETLSNLQAEDSFTAACRGAEDSARGVGERSPDLDRLMDRIRRLGEAAGSRTHTGLASSILAPSSWSGIATTEKLAEEYPFLSPAEGPGEIGRIGGYRVLAVIGSGAMGIVFEGEDAGLRMPVAIKVMRPVVAADPAARQRFVKEAQAIASLRHDQIVGIFRVGEERGVPFLVMPRLQGETLASRLKGEGKLPLPELLRIGREIADGLTAAHAAGMVHRDLKPSNLWLERGTGRVKILDFGLVRVLDNDQALTQTNAIVGTIGYMSLDQIRGEVEPQNDLYALGCILYEMSTGQPPFAKGPFVDVIAAKLGDLPPAPIALEPTLPREFSNLVMRLLAKSPAEKTLTAEQVAHQLRNWETNGTSHAANPPRRGWRWLIAAGAAGMLTLAAALFVLQTGSGELEIEVSEPDVKVMISIDQQIEIKSPREQVTINVPSGKHVLEVRKDGFETETREFRIVRNGRAQVAVILKPKKEVAAKKDVRSVINATNQGWTSPSLKQGTRLTTLKLNVAPPDAGIQIECCDNGPCEPYFIGRATKRSLDVPIGKCLINVTKPGFESQWHKIDVNPENPPTLTATLKQLPGYSGDDFNEINLEVSEKDVTVFLRWPKGEMTVKDWDGFQTLRVPRGKVVVRVSKPGFETETRFIRGTEHLEKVTVAMREKPGSATAAPMPGGALIKDLLDLNKISSKPAADDEQVKSPAVPPEKRLMSIRVFLPAIHKGNIKPGDRVDLISTFDDIKGDQPLTRSLTISKYVLVFDVDRTGTAIGNHEVLTIACSPEESQIIKAAQKRGRLTIALRSASELEGQGTLESSTPPTPEIPVAATSIPKGMRLSTIPVAMPILQKLHPGDRVDILSTYVEGDGPRKVMRTKTILEEMVVFAVDKQRDASSKADEDPVTRQVTILCSPENAHVLQEASKKGLLQISVRRNHPVLRNEIPPRPDSLPKLTPTPQAPPAANPEPAPAAAAPKTSSAILNGQSPSDGKPPTVEPTQPSAAPVPAPVPKASTPPKPEVRTEIDQYGRKFLIGMPHGLVSNPAYLPGISSWSIDTILPRDGFHGEFTGLSLSPDDHWLAVGGVDGVVRVYEMPAFRLHSVLPAHLTSVGSVVWSPRGDLLATSSTDRQVIVWEPLLGKVLVRERLYDRSTNWNNGLELSWSPDGTRVAIAAGKLHILDVPGKKLVELSWEPPYADRVKWSPDGKSVAVSSDRTLELVDPSTGRPTKSLLRTPASRDNFRIQWSRDGKTLAIVKRGATAAQLCDVRTGAMTDLKLPGGEKRELSDLCDPCFSADGEHLYISWRSGLPSGVDGSKTGGVGAWSLKSSKWENLTTSESSIASLISLNKSGEIVVGSENGAFLNVLDGKSLEVKRELGSHRRASLAQWSPDGERFAWTGRVQTKPNESGDVIAVWSLRTAKPKFRILPGANSPTWSNSGRLLAVNHAAGTSILGPDLPNVEELQTGQGVAALAPDGRRLAVFRVDSDNPRLEIWDAVARVRQVSLPMKDLNQPDLCPILAICWHPDGRKVYAATKRTLFIRGYNQDSEVRGWVSSYPITNVFPAEMKNPDPQNLQLAANEKGDVLVCGIPGGCVVLDEQGKVRMPEHPRLVCGASWDLDATRIRLATIWGSTAELSLPLKESVPPQDLSGKFPLLWGHAAFLSRTKERSYYGNYLAAHFVADSCVRRIKDERQRSQGTFALLRQGGLAISPEGHIATTNFNEQTARRIEDAIVYVIDTGDHFETLSPGKFAEKFGWKNDPMLVVKELSETSQSLRRFTEWRRVRQNPNDRSSVPLPIDAESVRYAP